jgi:Undecaprenyl-phosphate galactose phosphotransferase WbaP
MEGSRGQHERAIEDAALGVADPAVQPSPSGVESGRPAARAGRAAAAAPAALRAEATGGSLNPIWARVLRVALLALTDLLALWVSGTAAYLLWARPVHAQPAELYLPLGPLLTLLLAGYLAADLYPGFGLGPVESLRRTSLVTGFGFVVLASFTFAVKLPHLYSRMTFAIALALSLVAVPAARSLLLAASARWRWWREPVVLIGPRPLVARTIHMLRDMPRPDYEPVAVLDPGWPDAPSAGDPIEGVAIAGGLDHAQRFARRGVQVAILATEALPAESTLDFLQQHFFRIVTLRGYEHLPVEGAQLRNVGGALTIEYTSNLLRPHNRAAKRALDLAIAGLALMLASPVLLVTAIGVRLVSRGRPFYAQERSGYGGRQFSVLKVRTMYADAERRLEEHLRKHPEAEQEWRTRFKLRDDPRLIPGLGRFLRRFSLDELPQLWNVLRGDMSLVGPRPFPDYHLRSFPPEFLRLRERMRPGITGLWQVMVRSEGTIEEQQFFDTYYLRNWSVWLDLYILGRTAGAVLTGKGAY